MKNDIKKYLTLGAVLAGSAFMVSCDADDVSIIQDTGVADAINNSIGDKPIAPIALAEFPLTSLKLAFANGDSTCFDETFGEGDEVEFDFDSTTATSSGQIEGDALADATFDGSIIFGFTSSEASLTGITADPTATEWTIDAITIDETLALSDLRFVPLSSDQRSVSGAFYGAAFDSVNINVEDPLVLVDTDDIPDGVEYGTIDLDVGPNTPDKPVNSITVAADTDGNSLEILSTDGTVLYEDNITDENVVLSVSTTDGCVYNFIVTRSEVEGFVFLGFDDSLLITTDECDDIIAYLNSVNAVQTPFDVSNDPLDGTYDDDITGGVGEARLLIAAPSAGTDLLGSYRHDFDSSIGTAETLINAESGF